VSVYFDTVILTEKTQIILNPVKTSRFARSNDFRYILHETNNVRNNTFSCSFTKGCNPPGETNQILFRRKMILRKNFYDFPDFFPKTQCKTVSFYFATVILTAKTQIILNSVKTSHFIIIKTFRCNLHQRKWSNYKIFNVTNTVQEQIKFSSEEKRFFERIFTDHPEFFPKTKKMVSFYFASV
jgi:hypothetical protein